MSTKVLVIGIDALDSQTLKKHRAELPNFNKLIQDTGNLKFDGVFPPDSPTSWASIYTGLNPAKHGILLFIDPLKRVSEMVSTDVDDSNIRGKTFWDIAGMHGKKVCILPHLLGYPVWPVNGIMIGRSGVSKDVQFYPEELSKKYNPSRFKWDFRNFPGKNKHKYTEAARNQIEREVSFALDIFTGEEWDLFFVSFGELDSIQYSFWNYYDPNDPSYPGENQYQNVIPDFYKAFDQIIGRFMSLIDENTAVIVVSDHGIGSRPVKLLNVNETLRRIGYLKLNNEFTDLPRRHSMSSEMKRSLLKFADKHDLANYAAFALRLFPTIKDWFVASKYVDWEESNAYLTDQSGIKNYPYGGILVKAESVREYELIRAAIMQHFVNLRDPETGNLIVNWIRKREDLYQGKFVTSYPDITFEFVKEFGAGNAVPSDMYGLSSSHNIAPGCHKQHHATFLISCNKVITKSNATLMDVTPTILDLLNINLEGYEFDGDSVFTNVR